MSVNSIKSAAGTAILDETVCMSRLKYFVTLNKTEPKKYFIIISNRRIGTVKLKFSLSLSKTI